MCSNVYFHQNAKIHLLQAKLWVIHNKCSVENNRQVRPVLKTDKKTPQSTQEEGLVWAASKMLMKIASKYIYANCVSIMEQRETQISF